MAHLMTNGEPCGRPDGHGGQHASVQALERHRENSRKWRQEKYRTDPEWVERRRESHRELERRRRHTDPEYREYQRAYATNRYWENKDDPVYQDRQRDIRKKWQQKKHATDPAWVERQRERKREYQRNKMHTDPDYYARQRALTNKYLHERHRTDPWYRARRTVAAYIRRLNERLGKDDL